MEATYQERSSWLDRPVLQTVVLNRELILFGLLLLAAFVTRFYLLEPRVMSHDENSHVYYSWLFNQGQGYRHDPITHGPFQFHAIALSYALFGANDFTARIPVVLFSIASVAFLWGYRRYLGRAGALVAAGLMVISPYMLYYGRYVRNESYVALYGLVMLWAILRYLESGRARYLFTVTAASALHYATKETAFIYTAQALIFLAFVLVFDLQRRSWLRAKDQRNFLLTFVIGLGLVAAAGMVMGASGFLAGSAEAGEAAAPAWLEILPLILIGAGALFVAVAGVFILRGYGWRRLISERAFALVVVIFTMVLPMLAPFPVKLLGFDPIEYQNSTVIAYDVAFVLGLALVGAAVGLLWNPKLWLLNLALFYGIFTVLYTSVFTNAFGFMTGLVGSLGYWLDQQEVNRGSQPLYYYWGLQIPLYEFLPLIGSLLAVGMALLRGMYQRVETPARGMVDELPADEVLVVEAGEEAEAEPVEVIIDPPVEGQEEPAPVLALFIFWAVSSLLAYTIAGEKMPWLTVHITLPMILLSGWSIGRMIERMDWSLLRERLGWATLLLLPVFLLSFMAAVGSLLGANPPFQGQTLEQLQGTTTFVISFITAVASGVGLFYLFHAWPIGQIVRLGGLYTLAILAVLTARAAFRASYINYDNPTEYLVYAHSAGAVKEALAQIEEISVRTTGGKALKVAYDNETSYPYWWYLRDYPNAYGYGANPTRMLRDYPVILIGDDNFGKIEPVVGQAYHRFDYVRLWWPNQDYFYLTQDRVLNAVRDPQMRQAIWEVWLNRDYTRYSSLVGAPGTFNLPTWAPADRMRLYVRKDIVGQVWNYGAAPSPDEVVADPYEGKGVTLQPAITLGSPGTAPGQFSNPRGIAAAPDGTLYVADTDNNRIQHITPEGEVLHVWGYFGTGSENQPAPPGAFNQPWGVAVGPDGSVYVADLWNYRIQKFTAAGEFLTAWGRAGLGETPDAFWGPRDVAVDPQGRVYVTDTGNDRVVVFDSDGGAITSFGQAGMGRGQMDEPVSVALDAEGRVYVSDTWNQRIQVFSPGPNESFAAAAEWEVAGWFGQSAANKPYLAVSPAGYVYATDPEGYRVLQWTLEGEFVRFWGDYAAGPEGFGLTGGIAADELGGVWVTDPVNNRLFYFIPPEP
jgi:predicted membrane-bound mannosyltransferase/DNA-binding beta-propeller fold protein YncE